MKEPSGRQWAKQTAGGLTALLLVLLLSAAARASCGDYVRLGAVPAAQPGPDHPPPAAPGPCRGPSCSRAPAPLLPPLAAPAPGPAEQWACLPLTPADPEGGPFLSLAAGPARRPQRPGSSVYHPPRPAVPGAGR
jgi:hypothetical protein